MRGFKNFQSHCRGVILVPGEIRECAATVAAVAVAVSAAATVASTAYKASQGGSTGTSTATQRGKQGPPPAGSAEHQFQQGTNQLLDEARSVTENATGQGQQIDPQVYRWLGMDPIYEDRSAQLQDFAPKVSAADQSLQTLQNNIDSLQAIPKHKRTPAQRKELKQSIKNFPKLQKQVSDLKSQLGELQTMPNKITGFNHLDPKDIPPESPFSGQNPLNQAQAAEARRLNEYLAGGQVDPTLKHQWDAAESKLRMQLSARYGPDYENTSVGQIALQNLARQKNESFSSWNEQMVEKYNTMAFGGAADLQKLLSGQIHLAYAPSEEAANRGKDLQNAANARVAQESALQRERGIKTDISGTQTQTRPFGLSEIAGAGKELVAGTSALSKLVGESTPGTAASPYSGYTSDLSQAYQTADTATATGEAGMSVDPSGASVGT